MKKILIIACSVLILAACKDKKAGAKIPLKTQKDSFAYAFGTYVGTMLHSTNIKEINWEVFKSACEICVKNGDSGLALDKETIRRVLDNYANESKFGGNKKKGETYIAKRKGDGFTKTASGLHFKMLKPGNGVKPNLTDTVFVFYTGTLPDGSTFDSNMGKKALKVSMNSGAIKGFLEALSMMDEGSTAEVIIPYELAYGKDGSRDPYSGEMMMEPFQTLTFLLQLESIKK